MCVCVCVCAHMRVCVCEPQGILWNNGFGVHLNMVAANHVIADVVTSTPRSQKSKGPDVPTLGTLSNVPGVVAWASWERGVSCYSQLAGAQTASSQRPGLGWGLLLSLLVS